ncbi:MAG: 4-(cytidine 5'-diphospho)-2-C-methyl-D-erythritol kinase [Bacteroidales bacterium]|nr:4-(cytidine 5'-diphospho)-2-C-methyl-D-erythritol kinase [Bacteroidales bacterium]MCF8403651.1 4-(cytidine 5'-diphospho)-2-C-methyl-D-erythritol kinase [Bacteroidales bacterium]
MISFPSCKINLGLSVLNKRIDGFHNVKTILYPIPLNDALEIIPSSDKRFSFTDSGLKIQGDRKSNLVVKAYELLKSDFALKDVHIHLYKAIPMGAGLGGGSADAAHTIMLLNQLFKLNLSNDQMEGYCRQLGSDCAFFIKNTPALAFQKGDQFKAVKVDLTGYHIIIVKPEVHIKTPEAYSWITPSIKESPLHNIISNPVSEWNGQLINDFEIPVSKRFPVILDIKEKLLNEGALYASLTGSGAALYGIFSNPPNLNGLFKDCFVWKKFIE